MSDITETLIEMIESENGRVIAMICKVDRDWCLNTCPIFNRCSNKTICKYDLVLFGQLSFVDNYAIMNMSFIMEYPRMLYKCNLLSQAKP